MILVNVSFERNGVYQSNLYKMTKENDIGPDDIRRHIESRGARLIGIEIATADDMRPGKPVIEL